MKLLRQQRRNKHGRLRSSLDAKMIGQKNNFKSCRTGSIIITLMVVGNIFILLFYRGVLIDDLPLSDVSLLLQLDTSSIVSLSTQSSSSSSSSLVTSQSLSTTKSNTADQANLHSKSLDDAIVVKPKVRLNVDLVWNMLLHEGSNILKATKINPAELGVVVEVGMHRAKQCQEAASAGFEAHCVEPSPNSFRIIQQQIKESPMDVQKRIHLYNFAAGKSSEETIKFNSRGGTGDHVGTADMWTMKVGENNNDNKDQKIELVPVKRMDDIIQNIQVVYLMKIDTQGYEPNVISGLSKSLEQHKIKFLLFEYWPRGIDLIAETPNQCTATKILDMVTAFGYKLYALPIVAHPKAPQSYKQINIDRGESRPIHDWEQDCQWFFDLEQRYPSVDYKMGYWTDMLAVAPGAKISNPVSMLGKALVTS